MGQSMSTHAKKQLEKQQQLKDSKSHWLAAAQEAPQNGENCSQCKKDE